MRNMKARNGNIRELPAYGIIEVARYLRVPRKTIEYWVQGASPILQLPLVNPPRFSFMNLLECHVINSMRREGVRLEKIRTGLETAARGHRGLHPLLEILFHTDGVDLFIRSLPDDLLNVSLGGQWAFRSILEIFLHRIERDAPRKRVRFFPFVVRQTQQEPKIIQMDAAVAFGRPVIAGTGIQTSVIASRFAARESIADLAGEYGRTPEEIQEALRWESGNPVAA